MLRFDKKSISNTTYILPFISLPDFDAVAVIRGEMWAFKSRHFWRIHHKDLRVESRADPVELTAFWYGLPANVDKVDAVYERPDHKIVFFAGKYFYVLAGNSQLEQGPTPLFYLGLPDDLDHVDAAMTWGYNGKTFFFSGEFFSLNAAFAGLVAVLQKTGNISAINKYIYPLF